MQDRPEHLFIGARRSGKTLAVEGLRAQGYWAHEHQPDETGRELERIYAAQRKIHAANPSEYTQPRIFMDDTTWWLHGPLFHYVNPHLVAQISCPEAQLENALPTRTLDWIYRYGTDARGRLIPELALAVHAATTANPPLTYSMAARREGAKFIERVYPELVPCLVWGIPFRSRFANLAMSLRIDQASWKSRMRSFRQHHPLPHGLTYNDITEFLVALGFVAHSHMGYLKFAPMYAAGLQQLKNTLTHEAIKARLGS